MKLSAYEQKMIDFAEQQLIGFAHAAQGYDLEQLVSAMGLTKKEWDVIKRDCKYLTPLMIEVLNERFK